MSKVAQRRLTRCAWLMAALSVSLTGGRASAVAQADTPRSTTGRHAPPRAPRSDAGGVEEAGRWAVAIGPGLLTSGDLFRVTVPSGGVRQWTSPAGATFASPEFLVTLDEDLAFAGSVALRVQPRWLARLDLSWAEFDATAEARVGQSVELHAWERLTTVMAGLDAECQLVRTRAYPYATAGLVLVRLSALEVEDLDQTRLGLRGGLGFHVGLGPSWGVRGEVRDTWQKLDLAAYAADAAFAGADFRELGPQHLFELLLQVRGLF